MVERAPLARWERFWFGEGSLVRLALFRIVLLCAAFDGVWLVHGAVFQQAAGIDAPFLRRTWNPIYAFELLDLGPPGAAVQAIWILLLLAIVLGILGLFTRVACAVAALLAFYWIGSEYSFGKPHHTCVALVFGLFALPFAPVGARLSLDSLVRRLRAARLGADPLAVPSSAPWADLPVRVTQLTIALGYFFAGATKLAVSGLAWANGYTLMSILAENRAPWSGALLGHRVLLVWMSAGLLVGQAGFPVVFAWRAACWVFVPLAILFHVTAMQTMDTGTFLTLWLTLTAFVELDRVPGFLARRIGSGAPWRRALAAVGLGLPAAATVLLYCAQKPFWLRFVFVPLAAGLALASLPRLLPALEIVHDPRDRRQRRTIALLAAFDWAHRLAMVAAPSTGGGIVVRVPSGSELRGRRALRAVLVRLPLAPLCAPFVARAFRDG